MTKEIIAYKGFNQDWRCRDFQYEVGSTYTHEGEVKACESGFHACTYPLDVLNYYPAALSKFARVKLSGAISTENSDSKVASEVIELLEEISLHELTIAAITYTFDQSTPEEGASATGDQGAASATGYQGAASATGDQGAASATGDQGAASATGYRGCVMGSLGNALFLTERDDDYNIINAWAGIVGKDGVEPNVWYTLVDGKLEVK